MKQNKYDDIIFFEKYSKMDRSTKRLTDSGAWIIDGNYGDSRINYFIVMIKRV